MDAKKIGESLQRLAASKEGDTLITVLKTHKAPIKKLLASGLTRKQVIDWLAKDIGLKVKPTQFAAAIGKRKKRKNGTAAKVKPKQAD